MCDRFQEKIPNLNDNFTVVKGAHTFKAGFGFQQNLDVQAADIYTQYTFPTIAAYLSALSGVDPVRLFDVQRERGAARRLVSLVLLGFLRAGQLAGHAETAGDRRRPLRQILRAVGRSELPVPYSQHFHTPGGDFAPRLGIAYSIDSKTVLRVNSGIFYEAPPTNLWYNALYNDGGSRSYIATISSTTPGAPAFPSTSSMDRCRAPRQTLYTITPNFKDGYAINSSIQITRQFSQNDALTVGYANTGGRNLEFLRNMNLINPIRFLADGRPVYSPAGPATRPTRALTTSRCRTSATTVRTTR